MCNDVTFYNTTCANGFAPVAEEVQVFQDFLCNQIDNNMDFFLDPNIPFDLKISCP